MKLLGMYFKFNGRLSLKDYWIYWNIPLIILILITQLAANNGYEGNENIIKIFNLLLLFIFLSTSVKRLHDLGKSGWWVLLNLIPIIGSILMGVYLSVTPGIKNNIK